MYANRDPMLTRFKAKMSDARRKGIEFDLVFEEVVWPTHCPALGIELDYSYGYKRGTPYNSPSFDRIDPTKGYIRGNTIIVSHLANSIKTNATVDELERVASFYRQLIPQVGEPNAEEDHRVADHAVDQG